MTMKSEFRRSYTMPTETSANMLLVDCRLLSRKKRTPSRRRSELCLSSTKESPATQSGSLQHSSAEDVRRALSCEFIDSIMQSPYAMMNRQREQTYHAIPHTE